jgi:HD-GYP domain-containing protein (c-di-GMP phosphodiesterase class II)
MEEKLLRAFFAMYRTARIVEEDNVTFKKQVDNLYSLLKEVGAKPADVDIKTVGDRYFVNDKLVPFVDREQPAVVRILTEWRQLGLGGVTFLTEISHKEIAGFFRFLSEIRPTEDSIESLSRQLVSLSLPNVKLLSTIEVDTDEPTVAEEVRRRFRTMARKAFFQAITVVQEATANTIDEREIDVVKTKRVVHTLIDHIMRDESSLIELTGIKNFDDYTYAHCTNVCVYALTLGVRIGLARPQLSQLGFAALFHDIGKVKLPGDLVRKPDAYDENDWIQMQRHPMLGAKTILRNLRLTSHAAQAARVAFEHHINTDFTGYPVLHYHRRPSGLFSRIVSIVDTFDALSSGRVYLKKAMSPEIVLKKMRFQMHIKFDPFLLNVFNDIVGIYPAGSLVLLKSDEIALVLTHNERDRSKPCVKIVGDKNGLLDKTEWVDLSVPDQSHRSIVRIIEPSGHGLDIRDFILRD